MFGNDDEHIVKMWTPLHFTTGEDFNYFPKNPLFKLLNMTLRTVVYCVGPIILRLFLGLRVCGRENIKKLPRGGITVCNHVHILDCVMVACHMNSRRICIPTLEANYRIPLLRHLIRILGGIPIPDRTKPFKNMYTALERYIKKGHLVHIYPEAVLYPGYNGIRDFKRGAFLLAYDCNVPVIPYVIRFAPPTGLRALFCKKAVPVLHVLEPVYPDVKQKKKTESLRLMNLVHEKMEAVFERKN